jgi:hypothetical protein
MANDLFHNAVKTALLKDGWQITLGENLPNRDRNFTTSRPLA